MFTSSAPSQDQAVEPTVEENQDEGESSEEEEGEVKNIPVDHFMINLNFMGLD